ncbi:50S ribosomal protein L37ae [Candidatus Woesearchaeota archaeon]|nr:50S ribosomal protein L37ae [Candidatus Woesearchaeota archaeon]
MVAEKFSSKRYGVRYGRRLREKVGKLEQERRSDICPYCRHKKIDRIASGVWFCNKCKSKFTGRAYSVGKKVKEELVEENELKVEVTTKPEG